MSNQIYSNEVDLYPLIYTAQSIKGGGLAGTGSYIDVDTSNIDKAQSLVITDDTGSGTYQSPYIAKFIHVNSYLGDSTPIVIPAASNTNGYNKNFGPLQAGDYIMSGYVDFTNGNVGAADSFLTYVSYENNFGGPTNVTPNLNILIRPGELGTTAILSYSARVTIPANTTFNRFYIVFDTSIGAATANGTVAYASAQLTFVN